VIRKLVISNGRSERELLLVGSIVIGRDPACHISEPDPLLSRRHAEILANVHGVSIRDLNSRNGILVNGDKTREQILLPGDVVQMGHLQLRYVEENARPSETMIERSPQRRPLPPEPPTPRPTAYGRTRPEPTPLPGRWRPEPTPLPGRRGMPPPQTNYPQPHTPVPRGRAAFGDTMAQSRPPQQPDPFDQTIAARAPHTGDTTLGSSPVNFDATIMASQPVDRRGGQRVQDATAYGGSQGLDSTIGPGHFAFDSALAHLSGLSAPGAEPSAPMDFDLGNGAHLVANSELAVVDATPECAQLLGIPDEELIGDSLPDVFLRAVRRAYAQADTSVTLSITRGARGSITVTFTLEKSGGTD
jgi:hypothetical protein